MNHLSKEECLSFLSQHPDWALKDSRLVRIFEFPSFALAMHFVNDVATLAETHQHHPDIDIRYRRVVLSLTTHDAGGLTVLDLRLAGAIDAQVRPL